MQLLDRLPSIPVAVLGLVVGLLAWALPMLEIGGATLGYVLVVVAVLLFILGILPYIIRSALKALPRLESVCFKWPLTLASNTKPAELKLSRREIEERSIRYRSDSIRLTD